MKGSPLRIFKVEKIKSEKKPDKNVYVDPIISMQYSLRVKENVKKEEAEELKKKFEEAGAKVELK